MKNPCLNTACDCTCDDNFCSPSCQDEKDAEAAECSCDHPECALDRVPLSDDESENQPS